MDKLISVIVPIYNVEAYLIKCLNSIINQTYTNLEIILVDDGSIDNSGIICDEYSKIDKRIKVIHQPNSGLSNARNTGLNVAAGDLISFVDGDDYIELNMLEELKKNMDICDSDISMCNYFYVKNGIKSVKEYNPNNIVTISGKDKFASLQDENSYLTICAWNKLYKKEIFKSIRYPDGMIYEDMYVICSILEEAKKISYIDKPLYNYVYRNNSLSHHFSLSHFDKIEAFNQIIEFYSNKKYYRFTVEERNKKIEAIIINLSKMKSKNIKNKELYNKYYLELISTNSKLKWKEASLNTKLFKIFRRNYIYLLSIEYYLLNLYKNIKYKYTSL